LPATALVARKRGGGCQNFSVPVRSDCRPTAGYHQWRATGRAATVTCDRPATDRAQATIRDHTGSMYRATDGVADARSSATVDDNACASGGDDAAVGCGGAECCDWGGHVEGTTNVIVALSGSLTVALHTIKAISL